MLSLTINTNCPKDACPSDLLTSLSKLLSELLGKPEKVSANITNIDHVDCQVCLPVVSDNVGWS